jgi:hypothetical protein
MNSIHIARRRFLSIASAIAAWAGRGLAPAAANAQEERPARGPVLHRKPYIALQIGAVSFVDEGTEKVLDILQEKAHVNTLWLNTYTYDRGTGGRQIPNHPFPDHGPQTLDSDFQGGAFYNYNPKFFERTSLNEFRSPSYNRMDIIQEVVPKAKKRGMDVFAWDYNNADPSMGRLLKNYSRVLEVDVHGRPGETPCFNNSDYREHLFGKIEDYLKTYPDLAGIAWGCERMGPLMNMIGKQWGTPFITCFCADCQRKARDRSISVDRARAGYIALARLFQAAHEQHRPSDGYFVTFWRTLLEYPEILAWEKLWTDSYHDVRAQIYGIAKVIAPEKPLGFHIMHNNTLSPFYRAEEDFSRTKDYADFVKQVVYNNCAGARMAAFLDGLGSNVFADAKPEEFLPLYYKIMNYEEAGYKDLPKSGLSAGYVATETKRAIAGVNGEIPVYPGIDIDVPTAADQKQTSPEDVRQAVKAAFAAGAQGVVLSRKYSEMKLANLAGAGEGLREAGVV